MSSDPTNRPAVTMWGRMWGRDSAMSLFARDFCNPSEDGLRRTLEIELQTAFSRTA
jgi:hypothetical protein